MIFTEEEKQDLVASLEFSIKLERDAILRTFNESVKCFHHEHVIRLAKLVQKVEDNSC